MSELVAVSSQRSVWTVLQRRWQRSLGLRVVSVTMALGGVCVSALAWFIAEQVSDRLFEAKRAQILADASTSYRTFDGRMDSMSDKDRDDIRSYLGQSVEKLRAHGDGVQREVLLSPNSNAGSSLGDFWSDQGAELSVSRLPQWATAVSADMKEQLRNGTGQYYQSVSIATDDGLVPGLVVGQQVAVPSVGTHDLYLVYDLAVEQETLASVQRALLVGAAGLVILLGAVAWVVARLVVIPIRQAAGAANRLASGDLSERLPVRSADELGSLARSFNGMAQNLQDKIEAMDELSLLQRRFVSDVSHELRTPLTTIRMASDVIRSASDDFDPTTKRSSELLGTQLDRFERLLEDLLEISRHDAGAAELDPEPMDVVPVVEGVVDLLMAVAVAQDSAIHFRASTATVRAVVDRLRVERVVRNLVANAVEHCSGTPVEVTVAGDDDTVAVLVRDHGVGLAPADLERVFDRFWRADTSRARTLGGTGLGLAISTEDARLHGGVLEVWGEPGQGAAFRLTLPTNPGGEFVVSALPLPDRGHAVRRRQADADGHQELLS